MEESSELYKHLSNLQPLLTKVLKKENSMGSDTEQEMQSAGDHSQMLRT